VDSRPVRPDARQPSHAVPELVAAEHEEDVVILDYQLAPDLFAVVDGSARAVVEVAMRVPSGSLGRVVVAGVVRPQVGVGHHDRGDRGVLA